MKSSLPKFALSALATSLLVACGGGGSTPPATGATPQAVTLNFDVVNGAAVVGTTGCTTPLTVGTAPAVAPATVVGTKGTLTDMRYYVSKVSMIDAAGTRFPVALTETATKARMSRCWILKQVLVWLVQFLPALALVVPPVRILKWSVRLQLALTSVLNSMSACRFWLTMA